MRTRLCAALTAATLAMPAAAADRKVAEAVAKAESQIAKGRIVEAEKAMEKLVKQLPTAEAHAQRARVRVRLGNVDGAVASSAEAIRHLPSAAPDVKASALPILAWLDLELGSGQDAVTHAGEAAALAATPENLALLARAQVRVGDPAAMDTARKAIEADAQNAVAHEAMGHALLAVRRADDAAASFRKALELDVMRASARVGLARALLASGKAAEAVTQARKASEEDARSGEAFAVLGSAIMAAAPTGAKEKEAAWGEAIAQAQQGAFLSPRNPVVLYAVGQLFETGGNLDQAAKTYKLALAADPEYAPAQMAVLEIEVRGADVSTAIARVKEMIARRPQDARLQFTLGKLLARKGEWADAIEPLQKAAAGMANVAEVHALLGTAYQFTGRSDDALAAYEKAVALAPGNHDYRSTYGLFLGLNGRHKAGIAELEKVTADPGYRSAPAWVNLGWLYRDVRPVRAAESAAAYERSLQIDPKSAPAALGLGWAYVMGEKYDQAIAAFQKAMELDKATTAEVYNGLGWSYYFKRDTARAREAAGKAQAANRPVKELMTAIANMEKGIQAAAYARKALEAEAQRPQGPDVDALCNQLQRGSLATRRSAAAQLAKGGAAGAPCLVYALPFDEDLVVRKIAATSLGALGAAAGREACVQLQGIVRSRNPWDTLTATAEEMQKELQFSDLQKAAKGAIGKIGCP